MCLPCPGTVLPLLVDSTHVTTFSWHNNIVDFMDAERQTLSGWVICSRQQSWQEAVKHASVQLIPSILFSTDSVPDTLPRGLPVPTHCPMKIMRQRGSFQGAEQEQAVSRKHGPEKEGYTVIPTGCPGQVPHHAS